MFLKRHKLKVIFAVGLFVVFVVGGYLLSDDLFFKRLIRSNRITTPEEAFAFVESQVVYPPPPEMKTISGLTPRYMLTQRKYLWCDEGAILLATINHELGYETRLVDLVGDDEMSHPTILEVRQNGAWKSYDTAYNMAGASYEQSAKYYRFSRPVYRAYPTTYNWIIQNNFYLKHLALWLRGVPG
jgi:hypothetical protein